MKLGFALRDGQFVCIEDVARGKACQCVCPGCGMPVVARKGDLRAPHFAHDTVNERPSCPETAAHRLAKEIINQKRAIWLPPAYVFPFACWATVKEQMAEFDQVQLEQRIGDVQPDLVAQLRGKKLFIEIAVTHRAGLDKILKFRNAGISALEIRIPKTEVLSWDALQAAVVGSGRHKIWLCHRKVLESELAQREDSDKWWRESFGSEPPMHVINKNPWRLSRKFHMWYQDHDFSWINAPAKTPHSLALAGGCDRRSVGLHQTA